MYAGAWDYAMHNYAQLCTIMHNYAQLCKLQFNENTQGLQTRGILGLQSPKNRQDSKICSSHSCPVCSKASLNITISIIVVRRVFFGSERRYLLSMYPARLNEHSTSADVTGTWIRNCAHRAKVPDRLFQKLVSAVGFAIHGSTGRGYVYH